MGIKTCLQPVRFLRITRHLAGDLRFSSQLCSLTDILAEVTFFNKLLSLNTTRFAGEFWVKTSKHAFLEEDEFSSFPFSSFRLLTRQAGGLDVLPLGKLECPHRNLLMSKRKKENIGKKNLFKDSVLSSAY